MFEIMFTSCEVMKCVTDVLKLVADDGIWEFSKDVMRSQTNNDTVICVVDFDIKALPKHRCDHDMSVSYSLTDFAKLLKLASNEDSFIIRILENSGFAAMIFTNENVDKMLKCEFPLENQKIDETFLVDYSTLSKQEYDCVVEMSSTEFETIIKDFSKMGNTCSLSATKQGLKFATADNKSSSLIQHKPKVDSKIVTKKQHVGPEGIQFTSIRTSTLMNMKERYAGETPKEIIETIYLTDKGVRMENALKIRDIAKEAIRKRKEEIETTHTVKVKKEFSRVFDVRILLKMTKATPIAENVKISMSPDGPLFVEYKMNYLVGSIIFFMHDSQ